MNSTDDAARLGFSTRQLHAGNISADPNRPRVTPIYLTAGFEFADLEQGGNVFTGVERGYSYTRVSNPTTAAVERRIADLESGIGALFLATGQAATSTAILTLVGAGDHILSAASIYGGTREFFDDDLRRLAIDTDFIDDHNDLDAWRAAIRPETKVLFAESIPNPKNDLLDVRALAAVAQGHGIPLVIDNTLATPYLWRPLEYGADIVVHSASKFLGGHGAALGGVIVDSGSFPWADHADRFPQLAKDVGPDGHTWVTRAGQAAFLELSRKVAMRYGPSPSPLNAFLLLQGLETLSLRVQRQSDTALALATWLEQHPEVESVDYSGLASNRYFGLAQSYLPSGQGSVFSVTLRGGRAAATVLTDHLRLFLQMPHLGDVRSLVLHPASTTHASRTDQEREIGGIGPGLLRLSIGVEDADDLIADFAQALTKVGG